MGIPRQEYWSGLPCSPPGGLPDSGIEAKSLMSPALAGRFLTTESESEVAQSCGLFETPWTAAHQAPLSIFTTSSTLTSVSFLKALLSFIAEILGVIKCKMEQGVGEGG